MWNKLTALLVLISLVFAAWAQQPALPAALQGLVEAERAFAKTSVERGVRESFLTYFADDGIAFQPGPVNAKEVYGKLPVLTGKPEVMLEWAPIYGDIAESGELGYSTGPAVVTDNTPQHRPPRHSLFFSIWKKQANGDWRVILDLGVQLERAYAPLAAPYRRAPNSRPTVPKGEDHQASLLKTERAFFERASTNLAWAEFLHPRAMVYRDGQMPLSGEKWRARPAEPMTGEPIKVEVASSGDLGYSYGTYQLGPQEKGYYARVWRRDHTGQWRIVFDVAKATPNMGQRSTLDSARRLLDYDQKVPLDIQEVAVTDHRGVKVHDFTFSSPKGGRVTAYLVVPSEKGPHAGIVFGHWGKGNRTEFLAEAIALARAGAVSVLIDYPWERTAPWWREIPGLGEPEKHKDLYAQAIIDLRRAFDLLLARRDVDPKRIAYVGHSYGAQWGAILSAIDQRMKVAVLMAGVPSAASLWLESTGDAGLVGFRKILPKGQLEKFVEVYSQLDAIEFIPFAAPVSLFFQFARHERIMTNEHMQQYFRAASYPKQVKWYETGHELSDPQAIEDRIGWLHKQLGLPAVARRGERIRD